MYAKISNPRPHLAGTPLGRQFIASLLVASVFLSSHAAAAEKNIPSLYVWVTAPALGSTVSGTNVTLRASTSLGTSVQFQVDGINIGNPVPAPFETTWDATQFPAGKHVITATAKATLTSDQGSSVPAVKTSSGVWVTTAGAVPAPWLTRDIGSVGTMGSATATNGTFTVQGAGTLVTSSDAFRFVHQQLQGDCMIAAKVSNLIPVAGEIERAGVMIRDSINPNSLFCALYVVDDGSGQAFVMEARSAAGNVTPVGEPQSVYSANYVRLTRTGRTFTGARSWDGVNWVDIASIDIDMPSTEGAVQAGLAVSSDATDKATATFSNVFARTLAPSPAPTILENFESGAAPNWSVKSGAWTVNTGPSAFPWIDDQMQHSPDTQETTYGTGSSSALTVCSTSAGSISNYTLRFTVKLNSTGSSARAGVVYSWNNSGKCYKLLVNSAGGAELYKNLGGVDIPVASPSATFTGYYSGAYNIPWVEVEIVREGIYTTVRVNGSRVFNRVPQIDPELAGGGLIGLVTDGTTASFDNISITPTPVVVYYEDFSDGAFQGAQNVGGTWAVDATNTVYKTTSAAPASAPALVTLGTGAVLNRDMWKTDYTYNLTFTSPPAGASNKIGVVYNFVNMHNYYKFTLRGDGLAEIAEVKNDVVNSAQSSLPYLSAGAGKWNAVTILRHGGQTTVNVNGKRVFTDRPQDAQTDFGGAAGRIGVIAENINGAQFDDLTVTLGLDPYKKSFPKLGGTYIAGNTKWNLDDPPSYYRRNLAKFDFVQLPVWATFNTGGAGPQGTNAQSLAAQALKNLNPAIVMGPYSCVWASLLRVDGGEPDVTNKLNDPQAAPAAGTTPLAGSNWWAWAAGGTTHTQADTVTDARLAGINIAHWTRVDPNGWRYPQWFASWRHVYFNGITPEYDFTYNDVSGSVVNDATSDVDIDISNSNDKRFWWADKYRRGVALYLQKSAQWRPSLMLMGNIGGQFGHGGHPCETQEYQKLFHAALYEGAIGASYSDEEWGGWDSAMDGYRNLIDNTRWPKLVEFMGKGLADGTHLPFPGNYTNPTSPNFPTKSMAVMRYALASALMEDGYFGWNSNDYSQIFWFEEYDVILGHPIDPPQRAPVDARGLYQRRFKNGLAVLNPRWNQDMSSSTTRERQSVTYNVPAGYKRFQGGTGSENDGSSPSQIVLAPGEGVILVTQ